MSTNYVKNFDIGQIRLDVPYAHYVYELPLLSFGDALHTVGVSLVYQSKLLSNPCNLSTGFKLSLQKRLISNNSTLQIEEGNGTIVICRRRTANTYSCDDDSKRFLRLSDDGTYVLENSDYSKEVYDSNGNILELFDKYGFPYLTYEYENGKLIRVIYRKELISNSVYDKVIEFSYDTSNKITGISYKYKNIEKCTSNFVYTNNSLTSIEHYTGVDYLFSFSGEAFTAKSVNHGEAFSNDYGHQIIATVSGRNIQLESKIGEKTISKNTYCGLYMRSDSSDWSIYNMLEITDMHGVKTRVQFENNKPRYSYDIPTTPFIAYGNNYTYNANVNIYSNNQIVGNQTYDDGKKMTYNMDHSWFFGSIDSDLSDYFTLSGWVKTSDINLVCAMQIYDRSAATTINFNIDNIIAGEWFFFAYTFKNIGYSEINVKTSCLAEHLDMKDFRITYQESKVLDEDDKNNLITMEDVLVTDSGEIPLYAVTFYLGSSALSGDTYKIKTSDIVRYQINHKSNKNTNEIYYNDCKDVMASTEDLKVLYSGISTPKDVRDCVFGTKYCHGTYKTVTKTDTTSDDSFMTIESIINGEVTSHEIINSTFDIIGTTKDGVLTTYFKNSRGLMENQLVRGLGGKTFTYNDTSTQLLSSTDEFGTVTTYTTDDAWGVVTVASVSDGTSVTDEYDADMTDKVSKTFAKNNSRKKHSYSYTNGNLTGITHDTLNYNFTYTNGDLTEVKKFGNIIENHALSNEDKTLTSSYPSSTAPLYTVESTVDKYGKLTSVTGQYSNAYDIAPYYSLNQYRTIGGNGANDLLSTSTDLVTGNKTKYGYDHNLLEKAGVFNSSNAKISEQSFTYDDINRVTSDEFVYDVSGNKRVKADIVYSTADTSPSPDNRVASYSYKVNGTERSYSANTYDAYERLSSKSIRVVSRPFTKSITYDKTRISRVIDEDSVVNIHDVSYTYDALGRITSEVDGIDTNRNTAYVYDSFGQLIRENNKALDKTFIYGYNGIGNITSAKTYDYTTGAVSGTPTEETFTYNTTYKDRFRKIGNYNVTYNTDGCPTRVTIGLTPMSYSWDKGRLASVVYSDTTNGTKTYSFSYDGYGRRTRKTFTFTVGTTVPSSYIASAITNYTYDTQGRLIKENYTATSNTSSTTTKEIMYLYDESSIVGMIYTLNGIASIYYLDRNIKGDVLRIYGSTGSVVAEYGYDAYGNCTILSATNSDLANFNPIRYRGYYYDSETGLYYLNSRYYNPQWRRFISPSKANALNAEAINGLNSYVYTGNNPIVLSYPSVSKATSQGPVSASYASAGASINEAHRAPINLANGLYALSGALSAFDYFWGQFGAGLESGINVLSQDLYSNYIYKIKDVKAIANLNEKILITGTVLSITGSVYNNFSNSNYSLNDKIYSSIMDAEYYVLKAMVSYVAAAKVGAYIIAGGAAIGGIPGAIMAAAFSVLFAATMIELFEWGDQLYEKHKKSIFG